MVVEPEITKFTRLMLSQGYAMTDFGWAAPPKEALPVTVTMFEGIQLRNVHDWRQCQPEDGFYKRTCVIHRPTPHRMRLWPLTWRDDRGIFERHCKHGIGHPDPDQIPYWESVGRSTEAIHGCDGCCGIRNEGKEMQNAGV